VTSIAHRQPQGGGDRDYYRMAEVAERLDVTLNTAYAQPGELSFLVRRVGPSCRVPKRPFDRWLRAEIPKPPAEPMGVHPTLQQAVRLQVLANAGGLLRRIEQASPWLRGGQHYAAGLLASAQGPAAALLDARFATCPAELPELAARPLLPPPIPT
jgi:hypothetical protein